MRAPTLHAPGRLLGTIVALVLLATGLASAQQVQVNKGFSPGTVVLGGQTTVTVSLQNSSTTSAATITSFSDDIATMAGVGQIYTAFTPVTTCTGGTPSISGTQIVMSSGSIPIAPSSSTPGTCTITFKVYGDAVGNGFNTIPAANVVTSNGSPPADVTQTLSVSNTTIAAAGTNAATVQTGDSTSVSFTLTNPTNGNTGSAAPIPITNVASSITSNATSAYTVSAATITPACGGTFALPAAGGTTGTTTFSGLTIPAGSSCVVTLTSTTPTAETVNFTLPASPTAGYVTDAQNVTNAAGVSTQAKFVSGQPNVTKAFTPTSAAAGATSVLKITIQNVLSDYSFTSANETDTLPGTLLVSATTPTSTNCGSPTYGGAGTGTFTITGATIAAGASCIVSVTVNVPAGQTPGTLTNTIPAANFTGTLSGGLSTVTGAAAVATAQLVVTAAGGGISSTKVASPASAGVNVPVKITVTFTSQGAGVFHGGTFTDNVPQTLVPMIVINDPAYLPTYTAGCSSQGDTPASVFNSTTSVTFTGLDIAANGTCAVSFYAEFTNQTGVSRADTNVVSAASFMNASNVAVSGGTPQTTITELPTFTVTSYVASNSGLTSQPQLVSSTVNVPSGFTDTNGTVVINLTAGKVSLAAAPQITFTNCPATATVSSMSLEQFTVSLGTATLSQTCTISYYVVDESAAAGTFTPGIPTYSSPLTGNVPQNGTAQNNVTFTAPQPIGISKAYTPANQIQAGGTATAVISLVIPKAGTLAVTQAQGVAFTDNLPANLNFSATPNVGFTGCSASGQPAPSYVITGSSIAFSNLTVTTNGSTQTTCAVNFDVTSNVVGAPLNQIPAGAVTSTAGAGASNTAIAKASLTVSAGLGIAKTFVNTTLQIGRTDYVRFLITNTATPSNLTGGSLVDNMPASLVLASTTEGPSQAGDPALCGGTISGTVGNSSFTLNGIAVGGDIGGVAGQCVVYVLVAPAANAAPGMATNTIAGGAVSIGGYSNQNSGSGTVTLTAPGAPVVSKAFAPLSIAPSGTSIATITIANTATGAAPLGALALTDTLPANVTIAATPNAATTCGAGTVAATAGGSTVALSGGSIAANATCTISVTVTSTVAGSYTNTIAANALTDTQGATNAAAATATLQVAAPVTVTKAFLPTTIASGGVSALGITIANTGTGAITLSGLALTDTLPSDVTIAATPNASTTCGAGTVSALAGGTSVALSNGSVGAGASCAIAVNVTGTVANAYTNTIAANAVTDTQGASNAATATATLTIAPAALTIAKAFSPATIAAGGTTTLTIAIPNTASGAVSLSALALTDTLPAGITIAATPAAATTCGAGTVAATAGGTSVSLSGGSVAANGSCTIAVNVTGTVAASYTNTIAANALTDTQNVSNGTNATASLTITAGAPALAKAFAPATFASGGTSTLTITVANTATGAVALSALALTDNLPSGITVASAPNAATTCGAGIVTASAGGTSVALAAGSLTANASCTIVVNVTGTIANSYTNTIAANALTDAQSLTNASAAVGGVTIAPAALTIAKAFSPASIAAGGIATLTITIPNTASGAVALSALALTDTLPSGVTIAPTPSAATTCGAGTVAATAGGTSVALSGGTLAANASCTVAVNVTGSVANGYTNSIAPGALTDTQNVGNVNTATALLTITPAPAALSKSFAPASITPGGVATLTITIPNTAAGAVALTGMALTDTLPAGITIAATSSAATTCGAGTVSATAGGSSVALAGGNVSANASCTIAVRVTGTVAGSYTNTIAATALTDAQNVTNAAPATSVLTIVPGAIVLGKAFAPGTIAAGGTSLLTIAIPNTATGAVALTNLTLNDTLPAGITVAPAPNAATTCGAGTVTAVAGSASVTLAGGSAGANATCTITVTVTGSIPNTYTNTIAANALGDTQGITNSAPATAALTIAPNTLALSKAFAPASIASGGTATLTITIPNTAAGAVALTGMTLTDTLPANVTIAAAPNAATTCGAGTVTAAAGGASVALAGGSIAANATCTIAVNVTGTIANAYTNTIPANALVDSQGVTNASPASATLTIVSAGLTIAKAFAPASIAAGGTSVLTITIPNTAAGAVALSALALTDGLPAGVTIAAIPNAATTCGGTISAAAGATSVALAGGTVAANATCTISVNVTGNIANTYTNTIAASALSDAQNITNVAPASANLTITANVLALTKAFTPATIAAGGTSVLSVTISNTGAGAIALTGLSFADALPSGLTVATTPNAATSCGAGSVAALAGGTSVTLGGGSVAANAACTVTVNVTSAIPNTYANTIPASAVTDTQGTTNTAPATATLAVVAATLSVAKTSSPSAATVGPGETITYTITVTNNGTAPETNATIADTLTNATLVPGSVKVNRRPVSDAVITSAATFGLVPAGGTVTITYDATVLASLSAGATVTNVATAGGDMPCTGAVCTASSPPNSVQLPNLNVVKMIDALTRTTVLLGQTVTYSMTIGNTGTGPAAQIVLTDPVPPGITPLAGSVTLNGGAAPGATVAGQNVTVPIALLAPGAAATVTFQGTITATAQSTLTNVVSISSAGVQSLVKSNPVVAQLVPSTLQVTKTTTATTATAGDRVDYVITAAPLGGIGYTATTITDTLPAGETFAPGTARVNGRSAPPLVAGRTLTWTLPALTAPATLSYSTVIAPGVQQNQQLTNTVSVLASAPGGAPPGRGSASASVLITASSFDSCYPITGRVYLDANGSGHFQDPDTGIAAVHIYLDNGESVVTDQFGRYNFPCVHPGMHALRLNEKTLPPGLSPYHDRNIDSEKSTRRLVHHIYDTYIIEDINFAIPRH